MSIKTSYTVCLASPRVMFGAVHTWCWEPVPGYQHKMVLSSHLEYPICNCVHSYSISPIRTLFSGAVTA